MTDSLFAGRYALQRTLGRGAFGVVHLASDTRLGERRVALKVLHPQLSVDPATLRLFDAEAGLLAVLRHDHIITVHDAGVWNGQRYIVMEYIDGPSLAQVVAQGGAQPPARVAAWLGQAAEALAYAHDQGVIHRDLKAANILWEKGRDRIYVTDFGLAHAVEASGGSSGGASLDALVGTAAYRAPEVRKTGHTVQSDLYSLGVVAYELLAGRRPFADSDPLDLMMAHANDPVPPLPGDVPSWLAEMVMQLLAKDPSWRCVTGHDLPHLFRQLVAEPAKPAVASAPSRNSEEVVERHFGEGENHHRARRYELAIESYTRAIEFCPTRADFFWKRGISFHRAAHEGCTGGDYARAIADYSRAIELDPVQADFYHSRGIGYHQAADQRHASGDYTRAIADYSKAIELDADRADFHYSRGIGYHQAADQKHASGDYARAIADYTEAIGLDPGRGDFFYSRGICYHQAANEQHASGDYAQAIADYTKAIELDPNRADCRYSRGLAYHQIDLEMHAIADYSKAAELDPACADYYYSRGISYEMMGDREKAESDYKRAAELGHE